MNKLTAIVLAAGEGKRMKSKKPKVLHEVMGKALVEWVVDSVKDAGIEECALIVGHKAEEVKNYMGKNVLYYTQKEQLGTGHAVMQAEEFIKNSSEYVFVLCGDTPLITSETVKKTIDLHIKNNFSATVVTTKMEDPTGYGRIIRDVNKNVKKIVEHKDATDEERNVKEINSGMYCFTAAHLAEALQLLSNDNSQGEYYLTDTLEILIKKDLKVGAYVVEDSNETSGINDKVQLSQAKKVIKNRINIEHMKNGVTIEDPDNTYIDSKVQIKMDSTILPGCVIKGETVIGEDCVIGPNSTITGVVIGRNTTINNSVVTESEIGNNTNVGPFAYIRPKCKVGDDVKVGDYVELKAAIIGDKTKISHLTYVGDAEIGKNVNLGCGVVVVNYDGQKKHKTIVGDNAFVGCNTNLVSPVEVEANSYIAAGSTITKKVPEKSLAIARSKQIVIENWVARKGRERDKKI